MQIAMKIVTEKDEIFNNKTSHDVHSENFGVDWKKR